MTTTCFPEPCCPQSVPPMLNDIACGNSLALAMILKDRLSGMQLRLLESLITLADLQQIVHSLTISGIETYQEFASQ